MNQELRDEFLEILSAICPGEFADENILDTEGKPTGATTLVPATGYEVAVRIWIDTWETDRARGKGKFKWDDITGRAVMPNGYDNL
jgi:hypothetical protein